MKYKPITITITVSDGEKFKEKSIIMAWNVKYSLNEIIDDVIKSIESIE